MDTLLIAPPEARYVRAFTTREYLGLGYLASYLEHHGLEVSVVNTNCRQACTMRQAITRAVDAAPPLIGITVPTLPNLPGAVHLLRELRQAGYAGHITLGGHVPTFQYRDLLTSLDGLTSIVRGEGEQTLLELALATRSGSQWRDLPGLAYREGDEVVITPPRALLRDLDSLPFPRRPLAELDPNLTQRIAEVASSRGCYGNCNFCSIFSFYEMSPGPRLRYRSAENVVDELEWLVDRYGIRTVIFVDDNFLGAGRHGKRRARRIAELILERKLDLALTLSCRANDIDAEVLYLLKKAGLTRVFVGIESGVRSALDRFRKHVTPEQNLEALRVLEDLDIHWDMGFIIYDPDTNFDELRENVEFLRQNRLYYFKAATLLLNGMVTFPGTPVEEQLREEGRLERRMEEALAFMGACDSSVDYQQALTFANQTYTLQDPDAELMRRMIDHAYERLTPLYDNVWPLVAEWERWLHHAVQECQMEDRALLAALGQPSESYRALLHWNQGIGALVMNLLEEMVSLVETGKTLADFRRIFDRKIHRFLERGHPGGLEAVVEISTEFLSRDSVELELGPEVHQVPVAAFANDRLARDGASVSAPV